jgi:hypothetical protein
MPVPKPVLPQAQMGNSYDFSCDLFWIPSEWVSKKLFLLLFFFFRAKKDLTSWPAGAKVET